MGVWMVEIDQFKRFDQTLAAIICIDLIGKRSSKNHREKGWDKKGEPFLTFFGEIGREREGTNHNISFLYFSLHFSSKYSIEISDLAKNSPPPLSFLFSWKFKSFNPKGLSKFDFFYLFFYFFGNGCPSHSTRAWLVANIEHANLQGCQGFKAVEPWLFEFRISKLGKLGTLPFSRIIQVYIETLQKTQFQRNNTSY